jgi:hypothetical protein
MVNYSNGKIYKIEPLNGDEGDIYIGSTTKEYLSQRIDNHRSKYKLWKTGKTTKLTSFDLFDKYTVSNCKIILIENVNANSKDELRAREAFYIQLLKCVNKCVPLRTLKEYRDAHKDDIKKFNDIYYIKNKEKIIENNKNKYDCICGSQCRHAGKAEHFRSKKHQKYLESINNNNLDNII